MGRTIIQQMYDTVAVFESLIVRCMIHQPYNSTRLYIFYIKVTYYINKWDFVLNTKIFYKLLFLNSHMEYKLNEIKLYICRKKTNKLLNFYSWN